MKKMKNIIYMLIGMIVFLLSASVHAKMELSGKWYGQYVFDERLIHWLTDRKTDASFTLYLKECVNGGEQKGSDLFS